MTTDLHKTKISIHNLSVTYGNFVALENISGAFEPGSLTAVVGPNGGGKSTFIKALQKLVPFKGSIRHHCFHVCDTAYLPQKSDLDSFFPLSVYEVVAMGLWRKIGAFQKLTPTDNKTIHHALEKVGLKHKEKAPISCLSGGQFQRMLFARIIVQDSSLIILDEPFNSIDHTTYLHLMQLIKEWHALGKTIIVVLHNIDLVKEFFPTCLLLSKHAIAWGNTQHVLTEQNIRQSFENLMKHP